MGKASLVEKDRQAGFELLDELKRAGIPVHAAMWLWLPESDEWQLYIASPDVTVRGPLSIYKEIQAIIDRMRREFPISFDDIAVANTTNSFVEHIARALQIDVGLVHIKNCYFDQIHVQEAWVYKVDRSAKARPQIAEAKPKQNQRRMVPTRMSN